MMINIAQKMHTLQKMLKKEFIFTVVNTMLKKVKQEILRIRDSKFMTEKQYPWANQKLSLFLTGKPSCDNIDVQKAKELWRMYKSHRFDLLGSGWVENGYGTPVYGFEGKSYIEGNQSYHSIEEMFKGELRELDIKRAQRIWKTISVTYQPIDWQKDYKSGYRWSAKKWYRPQQIAKKPGGDIKVPWELSRMQQLPRMAMLSYVLPEKKEEIFEEFCNQLLDFIAMNPMRFGVNYMCTMDVGIRNANIVLAYSLFKNMEITIDSTIEKIITNYIFETCDFIYENLEWSYYLTSNHYFANIAGLLYGSAVLPECKKQKKWLKFSVKQIQQEIRKQFSSEGTNKEGSTAYHRLMGEMALYSVALIENLATQKKCEECASDIYEILYGAACFTRDITRPDGSFTQVGDNDSGLFFRLSITGELITPSEAIKKYYNLQFYKAEKDDNYYLDENMNDGRPFVASAAGMFGESDFFEAINTYPLEYGLLKAIRGNKQKHSINLKKCKLNIEQEKVQSCKAHREEKIEFKKLLNIDVLKRIDYFDFGLYIFKSPQIYLCINATDNGQKGNAGHAHNDKLSYELLVNNQCICEDPGTYVYTANVESRNKYRSTLSHNAIFMGEEQNRDNGLFSMYDDTKCSVLRCWNSGMELQVRYRGFCHIRKFEIKENYLHITDKANYDIILRKEKIKIARGYGKSENESYTQEE